MFSLIPILSDALGQDVARQAQLVKCLFELQREFILISTGYDLNDSPDSGTHFTSPLGSGPAQAMKMREIKYFPARHSYSPYAPHLQFVSDTIGALGWVVSGDRPNHFIRESYDGGKHHVKHIPGEMIFKGCGCALKYIPHKADVPPIYLFIKQSHSSGSKYFSMCLNMTFTLVYLHFEVNLYILKPFGFSNKRRR